MKEQQNDMLPSTSPTQFRSDAVIFVGELSAVADVINWPRIPELKESEATAERFIVAGHNYREELLDTSSGRTAAGPGAAIAKDDRRERSTRGNGAKGDCLLQGNWLIRYR